MAEAVSDACGRAEVTLIAYLRFDSLIRISVFPNSHLQGGKQVFEDSSWLSRLQADDCVLLSQLRPTPSQWEVAALFRAVLLTACGDIGHGGSCTNRADCPRCRLRRDVIAWVNGAPAPLSFEDVCTGLNLNAGVTRRVMLAFKLPVARGIVGRRGVRVVASH